MSLKKFSLVALVVLVVCGSFALPCQAQNTFRRQRGLRWLGQGFGDGYHRQNPGYDTSYYNPYTAHNSLLISQTPEYMAARPVPTNQELPRRFFNGVPFSAYAAPPRLNPAQQNFSGQQFQGSFSPSIGSGVSDANDDSLADDTFRSSENSDTAEDADDNDFRNDDDNDFRENQDGSIERDNDERMEVEGLDDREVETDGDAKDLGDLSGLNNSLSFDIE